jgi:hypothetical protein
MPTGGLGNLIALPLQRARRATGCTVFLDRELEPVEDQWALLASAARMDRESVETLSGEAVDEAGGLGLEPWREKPRKAHARQMVVMRGGVDEVQVRLGARRGRLLGTAGRAA